MGRYDLNSPHLVAAFEQLQQQETAPGSWALGGQDCPSETMSEKRITVIPFLQGKLTRDGKLSEPDIYSILDQWLERHPEVWGRERDIRISRGGITLPGGVQTESVRVTFAHSDDLEGYDSSQDADLYGQFLAEYQSE
jgi:hypothetical protein